MFTRLPINTHTSHSLSTTHNPQPNSSRHFGGIALLVVPSAYIVYATVSTVCGQRKNSFIKQLRDWAKLWVQVDVAKAKVV